MQYLYVSSTSYLIAHPLVASTLTSLYLYLNQLYALLLSPSFQPAVLPTQIDTHSFVTSNTEIHLISS